MQHAYNAPCSNHFSVWCIFCASREPFVSILAGSYYKTREKHNQFFTIKKIQLLMNAIIVLVSETVDTINEREAESRQEIWPTETKTDHGQTYACVQVTRWDRQEQYLWTCQCRLQQERRHQAKSQLQTRISLPEETVTFLWSSVKQEEHHSHRPLARNRTQLGRHNEHLAKQTKEAERTQELMGLNTNKQQVMLQVTGAEAHRIPDDPVL